VKSGQGRRSVTRRAPDRTGPRYEATAATPVAPPARLETLAWWLLNAAVIAVPLVVSKGVDVFRLPKELLLDGTAAVIAATIVIAALLGRDQDLIPRLRAHARYVALAGAALGWAAVTTLMSTQRTLSSMSLVWIACCGAWFVSALIAARGQSLRWAFVPVVPAIVNSVVAILQRTETWNPFTFPPDFPIRMRTTGLVGNPDDLGACLVVPFIAALALAVVLRGRERVAASAGVVVIGGGLLVSQTLTSVVAATIGAIAMTFRLPRKHRMLVALALTAILAVIFAVQLPIVERIPEVVGAVIAGDVHDALSGRTQPFRVAWTMFREHPLFGVGPGCFGYWYMPYRVQLLPSHPQFLPFAENYAEVHNDHLQILATMGALGYLLFIVAMFWCARAGRGFRLDTDIRKRFLSAFALPASLAFATLAFGGFPLELAAVMSPALFYAGAMFGWRGASE